jgi:hypothetical protein
VVGVGRGVGPSLVAFDRDLVAEDAGGFGWVEEGCQGVSRVEGDHVVSWNHQRSQEAVELEPDVVQHFDFAYLPLEFLAQTSVVALHDL